MLLSLCQLTKQIIPFCRVHYPVQIGMHIYTDVHLARMYKLGDGLWTSLCVIFADSSLE